MSFLVLDIILLVAFAIFISIFLYKKRKNLKKEGLLFLYKTKWGIKLINKIGKDHKKSLNILSYVSVATGFVLMGLIIFLFGKIVWMYVFETQIINLIKVPPIMPLLPYVPQAFGLNYLPAFYFTYWIIIIAIVAISHEFAHGIFAVNKGVKIKRTGFGFFPYFFPIFLAAFVELDEKKMEKKKIFHQMTILSAGTFANVLLGILFSLILILFFSSAFSPSGVIYDTYMYSVVNLSKISSINNISLTNATYDTVLNLSTNKINEVNVDNKTYFITPDFIKNQIKSTDYILLYDDTPAVKAGIGNVIVKINGVEIKEVKDVERELSKYKPDDEITITTIENDSLKDYKVKLEKNPENGSLPYLGIGFLSGKSSSTNVFKKIMNLILSFKNPNVYYEENFKGAEIIYNLIWWLVSISFSVALVNMLPVGIFDGGRFFYLFMLSITKNDKKAKKIYGAVTYLFLILLIIIMLSWGINILK